MFMSINEDHRRFLEKLKEELRINRGKYINHHKIRFLKGDTVVSIPLPKLKIPHFEYGPKNDALSGEKGDGDLDGSEIQEEEMPDADYVDFNLDEIVDLLIEPMGLPNLQPSQNSNVFEKKRVYNTIWRTGSRSLVHRRRTLKEVLKREIASGNYSPGQPFSSIVTEDFHYRGYREIPRPDNSATILYLMDTSGSMGEVEKKVLRTEIFWLEKMLERRYQKTLQNEYKGIKKRYAVHAHYASEVSREDFFTVELSGATLMYVGYEKILEMIADEQQKGTDNIYVFHYSDGEMWSGSDDLKYMIPRLREIVSKVNVFAYTQLDNLESTIKNGPNFGLKRVIEAKLSAEVGLGKIVLSYINEDDGDQILDSIRDKLIMGR